MSMNLMAGLDREREGASEERFRRLLDGLFLLADDIERYQEGSGVEEAKRMARLLDRLRRLLLAEGVRPTARPSQPLNLRYHEVAAVEPQADVAPDTILRVLQMGYEKAWPGSEPAVLRTARVVVSQSVEGGETAPDQAAPEQEIVEAGEPGTSEAKS